MADLITEAGIRALLSKELNSLVSIEILESTTSTNDYIKQAALEDECRYKVVIAEEQTGGKGRRGKSFISPKGCGIYLSIKFSTQDVSASYAQQLTALSAVAVCRAIEEHTANRADIKWPNDVYCIEKKVCGILCESQTEAYSGKLISAIAGIGIDVYKPEHDLSINQDITYLAETETEGLRNRLTASLIEQFIILHIQGIVSAREEYLQRSMLLGQDIAIHYDDSRTVPAHVEDINENLQLVVQYTDGKQETLDIGDFSISF